MEKSLQKAIVVSTIFCTVIGCRNSDKSADLKKETIIGVDDEQFYSGKLILGDEVDLANIMPEERSMIDAAISKAKERNIDIEKVKIYKQMNNDETAINVIYSAQAQPIKLGGSGIRVVFKRKNDALVYDRTELWE